ncbi:hypothetical protein CPC08DRAFT_725271 [Agrocybe pediades]|nr:hypothetical protein CPC08DRAFT_725271 [Agrocybe pediades]
MIGTSPICNVLRKLHMYVRGRQTSFQLVLSKGRYIFPGIEVSLKFEDPPLHRATVSRWKGIYFYDDDIGWEFGLGFGPSNFIGSTPFGKIISLHSFETVAAGSETIVVVVHAYASALSGYVFYAVRIFMSLVENARQHYGGCRGHPKGSCSLYRI